LAEQGGITTEIVILEPTGAETQFVAKLGSQTITGLVRERLSMQPGSPLRIQPHMDAVHLFDENGDHL